MACSNCRGAAATTCACSVTGGTNVTVTGTGTATDPFVVTATGIGEKGDKGDKGDPGTPGADGADGADGVGIESVNDNGDGTFNFVLTDDTVTDPVATIPGDDGPQGAPGTPGDDGADGVGIDDVVDNGDGTFSLSLSDGTTVGPVVIPAGPQGEQGDPGTPGADGTDGADGADGVSVVDVIDNGDGTFSFTLSDDTVIGPIEIPDVGTTVTSADGSITVVETDNGDGSSNYDLAATPDAMLAYSDGGTVSLNSDGQQVLLNIGDTLGNLPLVDGRVYMVSVSFNFETDENDPWDEMSGPVQLRVIGGSTQTPLWAIPANCAPFQYGSTIALLLSAPIADDPNGAIAVSATPSDPADPVVTFNVTAQATYGKSGLLPL